MLAPTALAALDTSRVEDIWAYLFTREGCDTGRWWMHAHAVDGRLEQRRFELEKVLPGQLGPIRLAG